MITKVGVKVHFDAAHYLPNYKGKCGNMHGHTWHITAQVSGPVCPVTGMVLDLTILKRVVNDAIIAYDHQLLNDHISMPTCETMAHVIAAYVHAHTRRENVIGMGGSKEVDITSVEITVQEGEGGWACVTL